MAPFRPNKVQLVEIERERKGTGMAPFRLKSGYPDGELVGRETGMAPFHPQSGYSGVKSNGH